MSKRVPVRRWGEPADYAALAVYLASRPGNGFHTGDSFVVDGGYSIFWSRRASRAASASATPRSVAAAHSPVR